MRFVGAVSCGVVMACFVGAGAAQAAPDESQVSAAKQHYAAATKFYDLAEYEGALREFKEAYRAVEDPAFLFNIAQCHRKLGHNQDAITFYRNYLRRAPQAANRAEVDRRIAELERAPSAPPPEPPAGNPTPAEDAQVAPLVLDLPAPAAATSPRAEPTLVASPAPAAAETPFYRRGWFWIVTGVVVAGAATTIIVLSTRAESAGLFCPDCAGTVVLPP
jgi:tetratricopeptide (TPR) repeat protein